MPELDRGRRNSPAHHEKCGAISIDLNGAALLADPSGAMLWPAQQTLAVADLHLEKGSAYARFGSPLPPYDTRTALARLADVIARFQPKRVICVGDSFHDADAGTRISPEDRQRLAQMIDGREWVWILGNHDRHLLPSWAGRQAADCTYGPLHFRHEARPGAVAGEVSGHFHPKTGLSIRGRHVSGRCFVSDGRRLILPAFGAYAGGLDVREGPIAGLFPRGFSAFVIGRTKLHRIFFHAPSVES